MSGFNFNTDALLNRMFRKADNVVWDLMSGKVGVKTKDGIATLEGTGDDATVSVNLMDQFSMPLPAFAQSTPKNGVMVGDIILRGANSDPAWVIEKKEDGDKVSFRLLKVSGETVSWKAPKIQLMGFDGGVMVLRSLLTMLPGGAGDLGALQSNLLPMLMMMGDDGDSGGMLEKMMPLMLMQSMGGAGGAAAGGGMMNGMMLAMMMSGKSPFGGGSSPKNAVFRGGGRSGPFEDR